MRSDKNPGLCIVIVAPSGTGKSTIISRIKSDFPEIQESISYTTREIRDGEKNALHYFFISIEEFKSKIANNDFIEYAQVHDNFYGTCKNYLSKKMNESSIILLDLDVQGAKSLKEHFGDLAQTVFIEPPSIEILEKRLRGRGTEKEETIEIRIKNARSELLQKHDFDYLVKNDDLEKSIVVIKDTFKKIIKKYKIN